MHFDSTLTTLVKSGSEYLISYCNMPTQDLYLACISESTLSASSGFTILNRGVPGVSKLHKVATSSPNLSIRLFIQVRLHDIKFLMLD
jgi:hypothetical protein